MQIILSSVEPANELATRVAERFALQVPHAREWAARLLGYSRWDALREGCDPASSRTDLSAPDSQCAPLAVRWRRTYQSGRLAELAGIDLQEAARIVCDIRPSDGFEFQSPFGGRVPRQLDPRLAIDDHRRLAAALDVLWGIASREPPIERSIKALRFLLQALLISEYPIEQYPYEETRKPYRTQTMLDLPMRTPKYLNAGRHAECVRAFESIRKVLALDWPADLDETVADILAKLSQVQDRIDAWRQTSAPHDDDPIAWRGVEPAEEEILAALAAAVPAADARWLNTSSGFGALSDEEAGRIIAHLRANGIDGAGQKPLRKGIQRLQAIVRGGERAERRRWERKTPVDSAWVIVLVRETERTALGKVLANSSAAALANVAGAGRDGRVVATTVAVAERILGASAAALDALESLL